MLARDDVVELMLVKHSLRTAEALHVPVIELRQYRPLSCAENEDFKSEALPSGQQVIRAVEGWRVLMANDEKKVRMFLIFRQIQMRLCAHLKQSFVIRFASR